MLDRNRSTLKEDRTAFLRFTTLQERSAGVVRSGPGVTGVKNVEERVLLNKIKIFLIMHSYTDNVMFIDSFYVYKSKTFI